MASAWLLALGVLRSLAVSSQDCIFLGAQQFSGYPSHPSSPGFLWREGWIGIGGGLLLAKQIIAVNRKVFVFRVSRLESQ